MTRGGPPAGGLVRVALKDNALQPLHRPVTRTESLEVLTQENMDRAMKIAM